MVDGFTIREHDLGGVAAGAVGAVRGAPGVEQHLLRPRRPGARRGALPRLRAPLRLLRQPGASADPSGRCRVAASLRHAPRSTATARPFTDDVELASAAFGQGRVRSRRCRWRWWRRRSPTTASCPQPYVVRDVRAHASRPGAVRATRCSRRSRRPAGTRVVSSAGGRRCASAMVDAVNGPLGRLYAGAGRRHALRDPRRADRRQDRHRRAGPASRRRTPGSSASRRPRTARRRPSRSRCSSRAAARLRTGRAHRRRGDGRVAEAPSGRAAEPLRNALGYCAVRGSGPAHGAPAQTRGDRAHR